MSGGGEKKKMFQAKSIIEIPHPTPPGVANWYSAVSSGPLWCSQSPTRKERIESYKAPGWRMPSCGLMGRRTNEVQERVYIYQYKAAD